MTTSDARPVLFVGCFAEPEGIGMNRLLAQQAQELGRLGVPVEILTWPLGDGWRGPMPDAGCERLCGMPYLRVVRQGVTHHVVRLPGVWGDRVPTDVEWAAAVDWGRRALRQLQPSIVHQHYWQHMWWAMQSATDEGIPTLHSTYDYGIGCLRTILVKGDDTLCDARPSLGQCAPCILRGRNTLGWANEAVASLPGARHLLELGWADDGEGALERRGAVRLPVWQRVSSTLSRCATILPRLSALIVTSPFARDYFVHLGANAERVHVTPWFHDGDARAFEPPAPPPPLVLAFVGRVSEEKGLHVLLDALERVPARVEVELEIAGGTDTDYGRSLRARFGEHAGGHRVRWLGWVDREGVHAAYSRAHVATFPSIWYDNTPAALIEALAYRKAVICTDVPSMTHLVRHEDNGLCVRMGDVKQLAEAITRLATETGLVARLAQRASEVSTLREYASRLRNLYDASRDDTLPRFDHPTTRQTP